MTRPVLKMGNPILKQVAKQIENLDDKQLLDIVQEMIVTHMSNLFLLRF